MPKYFLIIYLRFYYFPKDIYIYNNSTQMSGFLFGGPITHYLILLK